MKGVKIWSQGKQSYTKVQTANDSPKFSMHKKINGQKLGVHRVQTEKTSTGMNRLNKLSKITKWPDSWGRARPENLFQSSAGAEHEWLTSGCLAMEVLWDYMIVQAHLLSLLLSDSSSASPTSLLQEQVSMSDVTCSKRNIWGEKKPKQGKDCNEFIHR